LLFSAAGLAGACAGVGEGDADLGQAQLAIANVPANVRCFRVTAQGTSRTAVRSVDVMPGQTIQTTLSGLPTGPVTFTGEGFSEACSGVDAASVPSWISDPVAVTVATTPPVSVSLTLRPNGRAMVGADFQDDGCASTGAACMTDAQCCMGLVCSFGACVTPRMCMLPVQTPGDCLTATCDAAGTIIVSADPTDLPPDDGNACTSEQCMGIQPLHVPVPPGTPCNQNGGVVCNGAGTCVMCLTSVECAGADTECEARTCANGTCGLSLVAAGTPVSQQIPGDCRRNQCDGQGSIASVPDDTDVPFDNNPCSNDLCLGGIPLHSTVAAGTPCGAGSVCDGAGRCCDATGLCM
jgi:hypothetical protein